jgi:hypothetical protein
MHFSNCYECNEILNVIDFVSFNIPSSKEITFTAQIKKFHEQVDVEAYFIDQRQFHYW